MLCQQHWWLVPSLFLIIFSFWCFFPKSLLLTFHSGVPLKSWPLVLLPSRSLTFFRFSFWLPFLLSFFPSKPIPSCQVESLPSYCPSWFFFLGSLRYQPLVHELLVSKLSSSFLHHWVADRDVSVLVPCVFLALLLICLNLILALLHVSKISSPWLSLGILAQFLPLDSLVIFWPC